MRGERRERWPVHRRAIAVVASSVAVIYDGQVVRERVSRTVALVIVGLLIVGVLVGSLGLLLNDRV